MLMNCLFLLVQAADPDPNQGQYSGQNGRNPREQQAAAWLNAFLAQPQIRTQLTEFIYESLDLGGIDLAAGDSLGDMCCGILNRLASLQGADVQRQATLNNVATELKQLQESDAKQNNELKEFNVFAGAISDSVHLLREYTKLTSEFQKVTLGEVKTKQNELEKSYNGQQHKLLSIEEKVAKVEKCGECLKGGYEWYEN